MGVGKLATGLATFALLLGCSDGSGDTSWQPYFPLEDGRTWCYQVELPDKVEEVQMRAEGERAVAKATGALWIVRERWEGKDQVVGYRWIDGRLERALGLKAAAGSDIQVTELAWLEVLAGEAAVGSTWSATTRIFDADYKLDSRVQAQEDVAVPAGEYTALRVVSGLAVQDREVPTVEYEDWYVRDVGLVRSLTRQDGQKQVEMQLRDCADGEKPISSEGRNREGEGI